jgi:hypothetical protein
VGWYPSEGYVIDFGSNHSEALLMLQQVELYDNRLRVLSPLSAPYICDDFFFASYLPAALAFERHDFRQDFLKVAYVLFVLQSFL